MLSFMSGNYKSNFVYSATESLIVLFSFSVLSKQDFVNLRIKQELQRKECGAMEEVLKPFGILSTPSIILAILWTPIIRNLLMVSCPYCCLSLRVPSYTECLSSYIEAENVGKAQLIRLHHWREEQNLHSNWCSFIRMGEGCILETLNLLIHRCCLTFL